MFVNKAKILGKKFKFVLVSLFKGSDRNATCLKRRRTKRNWEQHEHGNDTRNSDFVSQQSL